MFESFRSLKNNGTSNIVKLLEIPFPVMLPIRSGLTLSGKHGVAAYAVQTLFYDYFIVTSPVNDTRIYTGSMPSKIIYS